MRIAQRFVLVMGVFLPLMLGVGGLAVTAMDDLRDTSRRLTVVVHETELDSRVRADLLQVTSLMTLHLSTDDPEFQRELRGEVEEHVAAVEAGLAEMHERYADRPVDLGLTMAQEQPYRALLADWRAGRYDVPGTDATALAHRAELREHVHETSHGMVAAGEELAAHDVRLADEARAHAESRYARSGPVLAASLLGLTVLAVVIVVWLVRGIVPPTRRYREFARDVAAGRLSHVAVHGRDELADLGHTLNDLVAQRAADQVYAARQVELTETLQVAVDEREAHEVLQRHLERAVPGSEVVVLNKNNSADRLEARTPVGEGSPLAETLPGATPRSCLAIRFARTHQAGGDRPEPLLGCGVCSRPDRATTCSPLLVGGEVIGSVLVSGERTLAETEEGCLRDSVVQAAPVLGNLRNLAIAELRAATDALTGLPNARSVHDTVKRMVAQAGRSGEPLSAAMVDLDHFKQINDSFGHGRGDDVLAAVGAVLGQTLRESDFVGRLGGEEFVALLPATTATEAVRVLERVRSSIADLVVPGVERTVSASFGVASVPEHAGEASELLRAADRALYAAKQQGRNRVVVATPSDAALRRGDLQSGAAAAG